MTNKTQNEGNCGETGNHINAISRLLSGTKENNKKQQKITLLKWNRTLCFCQLVFLSKVETLATGAVLLSYSEKGDLDLFNDLPCLSLKNQLSGIRNACLEWWPHKRGRAGLISYSWRLNHHLRKANNSFSDISKCLSSQISLSTITLRIFEGCLAPSKAQHKLGHRSKPSLTWFTSSGPNDVFLITLWHYCEHLRLTFLVKSF